MSVQPLDTRVADDTAGSLASNLASNLHSQQNDRSTAGP